MPVNAQGYYASQDDLPANVKALGDARVDLWRKVYNAAVDQHAAEPGVMAWGAVTVVKDSGTAAVFRHLPQNKRRDNDSHDSSQAGRDREPADVDNPNAVSPNMAEAAGLGNNTTDPEEDAPETQMREQFAEPTAKPQSPGKPPAAL